jgi:hypothetical protein
MKRAKTLLLPLALLFSVNAVNAQVSIEQLYTKGFDSRLGLGSFLEVALALGATHKIILEPNADFFAYNAQYISLYPMLTGYRHNFSRMGCGWYVQPMAGYTFGNTTIIKKDAAGEVVTNAAGDTLNRPGAGFTAGLSVGYAFRWFPAFSLELRYERVFVSGGPAMGLLQLRYVYTITVNRLRPGK